MCIYIKSRRRKVSLKEETKNEEEVMINVKGNEANWMGSIKEKRERRSV